MDIFSNFYLSEISLLPLCLNLLKIIQITVHFSIQEAIIAFGEKTHGKNFQ